MKKIATITNNILKVIKLVFFNKIILKIIEYIFIAILVVFLLCKTFNALPNFIKDHLPFIGRSEFIHIKHQNDALLQDISKRDTTIVHQKHLNDSLTIEENSLKNAISVRKVSFKTISKDINKIDSAINDCGCI